ncbi:hypothetical protein BGZ80_006982 [Entomortierella chlamydospora]|uniref:Uncharacterized protein n=1 Tax=Entomortierella chlamydospora TaxID=101097 RepID=A0A9P6MYS1_9FUNG|nr:hypothetical protein BGZ80_006982 [Entomortierella chlamydospora]
MTKYQPLFDLHQLVQLTHSTTGKVIFYSQVNLAKDDNVDEDEAGGWVLSAFTGKTYFEREYRREDLDDLLITAGDKDWSSFAKRFKKAVLEGYFHIVDANPRECKVIIDNEVHSRMGSSSCTLETIEIDMYPVNHASRGEKMGEFMFECASYLQVRGCVLNPKAAGVNATSSGNKSHSAGTDADVGGSGKGKSYDDLKLERHNLKSENADLKKEIERLQAQVLKLGSMSSNGIGATSGRPKSKSAHMAMMVKEQLLKKRKGVSALNPRSKKGVLAKGTEFGSDDEEDEE